MHLCLKTIKMIYEITATCIKRIEVGRKAYQTCAKLKPSSKVNKLKNKRKIINKHTQRCHTSQIKAKRARNMHLKIHSLA